MKINSESINSESANSMDADAMPEQQLDAVIHRVLTEGRDEDVDMILDDDAQLQTVQQQNIPTATVQTTVQRCVPFTISESERVLHLCIQFGMKEKWHKYSAKNTALLRNEWITIAEYFNKLSNRPAPCSMDEIENDCWVNLAMVCMW